MPVLEYFETSRTDGVRQVNRATQVEEAVAEEEADFRVEAILLEVEMVEVVVVATR